MSYDFNETYEPLRVYNQLWEGACVAHARGLAVIAGVLMHTGKQIGWVDTGHDFPTFDFVSRPEDWDNSGWETVIDSEPHKIINKDMPRSEFNWADIDTVGAYLEKAGFMTMGIYPAPSFGEPRDLTEMPIIRPTAFDNDPASQPMPGTFPAHAIVAVGYTHDGVIIQNSWGTSYGYKGRAILSWAWMDKFVTDVSHDRIDSYPLEGMTRPPQPFAIRKKPRMLIARRTTTSPVWSITGGVRSWIKNWAVLAPQGYTQADAKVIPATNTIWRDTTVVGPLPKGGDI